MAKTKITPTISLHDYKPDPKSINMALWGKAKPPSEEDIKEAREKLTKEFETLRNMEKKK